MFFSFLVFRYLNKFLGFDLKDAGSHLVISEMAALHKQILIVQGLEYLQVLTLFMKGSLGAGQDHVVEEFVRCLKDLPTKQFVGHLKV
jgi:hypothetical protein